MIRCIDYEAWEYGSGESDGTDSAHCFKLAILGGGPAGVGVSTLRQLNRPCRPDHLGSYPGGTSWSSRFALGRQKDAGNYCCSSCCGCCGRCDLAASRHVGCFISWGAIGSMSGVYNHLALHSRETSRSFVP